MPGLGRHGAAKYVTGTRLGTSHGLGWQGLLAERWSHSEGDLGEVQVRDTEVIVMVQGRLHVRRRGDGKLQHSNAVPGTIWLCPNGVREDMIHLYGEVHESIHLFLPALPLSRMVLQETDIDPASVHLQYQGGFRDPLIEQIAWAIRAEMTDPAPAGKVLVETLTTALGVHVARQYSNLTPASRALPPARGALDPRRLRRVTDFIEAHLGRNLTLEALAKEACLSPFHFARAFKAATGTAPHRYLTDRRIERAKALIARGELPLTEIAHRCGFSSQAYFTRWFKKYVGTTPGEYSSTSGLRAASPSENGMGRLRVDLTSERNGDVLSLSARGPLDDTTTSDFGKAVRQARKESDRALILDLAGITSISDSGLQTILLIARNLQSQDSKLVLCALSARHREKFRVTGIEGILPIHESKAEALASLDD